jgi:cytochrome c551
VLVALSTAQKLVLGGMGLVFVAFAVTSAFLLPRRNPDFPGARGVRLFVAAAAAMFLAMMLTVILVREEEAEGGHAESAAVEDVTQTGETETGDTGVGETGTATETAGGGGGGAGAMGDPEAGADVFASAGCGGCHTFAEAEASGTIGPDLDRSSIDFAGAVQQIRNGGGGMPPFGEDLSDEQIANVAAFVVEHRSG